MNEEEIWRTLPSDEDYEISSLGRVKSYKRKTPKILSLHENASGYLFVGVSGKKRSVHRLVLEAFVGPCPEGFEACHNNGIPNDNRVSNLRWDTKKSNEADKVLHGTNVRGTPLLGESSGSSKLTEEQVLEIRRLRKEGYKLKELEALFGVSYANISLICSNKTWTHIETQEYIPYLTSNVTSKNKDDKRPSTTKATIQKPKAEKIKEDKTCTDCGKTISQYATRCKSCAAKARATKIDWPADDELLKMLEESNYSAVGRQLGVSDNAIRKRLNRNN